MTNFICQCDIALSGYQFDYSQIEILSFNRIWWNADNLYLDSLKHLYLGTLKRDHGVVKSFYRCW